MAMLTVVERSDKFTSIIIIIIIIIVITIIGVNSVQGPVSTEMGDLSRVCGLAMYIVTSHSDQLSLLSSAGREMRIPAKEQWHCFGR